MASSNHGVDFEEGEFLNSSNRKYVIVTGHGRSGSNLILDMLDCHEATFCRNESNKLKSSKLSRLPTPLLAEDLDSDFNVNFPIHLRRLRHRMARVIGYAIPTSPMREGAHLVP